MAIYLRDNSDPYRAFVEEDFNRVDEKEGELNNLNLGLGLLGAAVAGAAATPLVRSLLKNRIRKESPVQASVPSSTSSDVPDRVYNPQKTRTELWDKLATVVPQTDPRPETYAVSQRAPSTWKNVNLAKSIYPIEMNPPSESLGGLVQQRSNPSDYFHPTGPAVKMADPVTRLLQDIGDEITEEALDRAALDEAIYKEHQAAVHYAGNAILANIEKERADEMLANFHGKRRTLVNSQAVENSKIASQAVEAVGSSEDQRTGRELRKIYRDEDVDNSSISNDQIQQETLLAQTFQNERNEIASQLAEQGLTVTPSRIEEEMFNRYGPTSSKYGREYTSSKHTMQLGATHDPRLFDDPIDEPIISSVEIAGTQWPIYPTSSVAHKETPYTKTEYVDPEALQSLKIPYVTESTARQLEYDVNMAKHWLGKVRLGYTSEKNRILRERQSRIEQEGLLVKQQLNQAVNKGETIRADSLANTLSNLRKAYRNPQDYKYLEYEWNRNEKRLRNATRKIEASIASKGLPLALGPNAAKAEEAMRLHFEVDPRSGRGGKVGKAVALDLNDELVDVNDTIQGLDILPHTVELRGGRPSIELYEGKGKGGGGRKVAEHTGGALGEHLQFEAGAKPGQTGAYVRRAAPGEVDVDPTQPWVWNPTEESIVDRPIRDYDIDDLDDPQRFTGDRTETGRSITPYGITLDRYSRDDLSLKPTDIKYTEKELADIISKYGSWQNYQTSSTPRDIALSSVNASEAVRKAALQRREMNPRGGKIPQKLEVLRRTMPNTPVLRTMPKGRTDERGRKVVFSSSPNTASNIPPQQITLPGVTGYDARQRPTAADFLAEELESYMSKYQGGRSSPLTSEIGPFQPTLF